MSSENYLALEKLKRACVLLCEDDVQALDPKIVEVVDELMGIHHKLEAERPRRGL